MLVEAVPFLSIATDGTGEFIAATSARSGIFTSTSGGIAWKKANGLPTSANIHWKEISCDASGQYVVVAAADGKITNSNGAIVDYTAGAGCLYMSTDWGLNWQLLQNAPQKQVSG